MAVMTMIIAVIALSFLSCQRRPVLATSQFVHLPSGGWINSSPMTLSPAYSDSTSHYDLTLAVRHSNSYRHCNLSLAVDVIAADASMIRKSLDITLADEYGNWSSGGFGTLYQATVPLVSDVVPDKASRVVVWQTMAGCDTLSGIVDVGIIARPK